MLEARLGPAEVRFTGRDDGDFSGEAGAARDARMRAVVDRPWKTVKQVHGCDVVVVDESTDTVGVQADAMVTRDAGISLLVKTADCAPVVLVADEGVLGVAHAGWRGLLLGVLGRTVEEMRAVGATRIVAALGPCVGPECYEFGTADLDRIAARFGDDVRARTTAGAPALDVRAGVRNALRELDVEVKHDDGMCTACDADRWWSHRARGEAERQATVAWLT